jgi:hypothetical protein
MNHSDLSSIREQLLAVQHGSTSDSETTMPTWEPPRSPSLPFQNHPGYAAGQPQQVGMVQALRQRSPQASRPPTPEEIAASAQAGASTIRPYLQRLYEEAEAINALCRQQEMAIQKFQRTVQGLDLTLRKQGEGTRRSDQFCELRDAALTTVVQDDDGRYVLTVVDMDLHLDEQQAFADAAEIRAWGQGRTGSHRRSGLLQAVWAEPRSVLAGLWQSLTATVEDRTRITPLDIFMWCVGGVIARKALNLILAALPPFGQWAVLAILVGALSLGLYRYLSSQRNDWALIARLFLALIGLGIGGQL